MLIHSGAMDCCHPRMRLERKRVQKNVEEFFSEMLWQIPDEGVRDETRHKECILPSDMNIITGNFWGCIEHRSWGSWSGVLVSIKLSLTWVYSHSKYASLPKMSSHGKGWRYLGLQLCNGKWNVFSRHSNFSTSSDQQLRTTSSTLPRISKFFMC